MTSCKTIEYVYPDYKLPETPVNYQYNVEDIDSIRAELSAENDILLQTILLNYITTLQKWTEWSDRVKEIIKKEPAK